MTRRAARTDANQRRLVEWLRAVGCLVEVISDVGRGVPDLLCFDPQAGVIFLVEVKDGAQRPGALRARQSLTEAERMFHLAWQDAPIYIINSEETAMTMLAEIRRSRPWHGATRTGEM